MLFDYLPLRPIVLDASAIINLLGCGDMPSVLRALKVVCLVEEKTLNEVERHPVPGYDHRPVIRELQQSGALKVERMSGLEYQIFISFLSVIAFQIVETGAFNSCSITIFSSFM